VVTSDAIRAGLIGHPVSQSLSAVMHQAWFRTFGIDGEYRLIDVGDERAFCGKVLELAASGWAGVNVTIPYKQAALEVADHTTDTAARLGAANLLSFDDGIIRADNTDAFGFKQALETSGWGGPRGRALVLGAGGAAPAVVHALQSAGFKEVVIANRTRSRAQELADRLDLTAVLDWTLRNEELRIFNLLVNTTSLGMGKDTELAADPAGLHPGAAVIDIVTKPSQTPLLRAAKAAGLFTMNGLPMLVWQGIPSFAAWTGQTPDDAEGMVARLAAREAEA
jgi:shikimate dehydrogenase